MLLEGKVSIISGIGPGLGQELAYTFAREGSHVVLAARTQSKLEEVEGNVHERSPGVRSLVCATDISDKQQTKRLVDATIAEFGRIDVLVNSAYLPPPFTMFEDADIDTWRAAYDVTVFGTLQLTQQVVPAMKTARRGSIVFVNCDDPKKAAADPSRIRNLQGLTHRCRADAGKRAWAPRNPSRIRPSWAGCGGLPSKGTWTMPWPRVATGKT